MKFYRIRIIAFCFLMVAMHQTKAQVKAVLQKSIALPAEGVQVQALQLLEDGTPVVVMNGGVYSPLDKAWLLPPDKANPIQDVAVLKEASGLQKLSVLQMAEDKVELRSLHRIQDGVPKFRTAQVLPLGLFHISVMDSATLLVWGREKQNNVIYAMGLQQTKKLFEFAGSINALQLLTANSMLAAVAGNLVIITSDGNLKPITPLPAIAISLAVDGMANIWVSTLNGIFVLPKGSKEFQGPLLDKGVGLLQAFQSQVWLLDPKKKTLFLYALK